MPMGSPSALKCLASFKPTYICLHRNGVSILLILGRRSNQSIVFPNCGITVRILDVNGRVAKIGIDAPQSVEILRGELALAQTNSESTSHRSTRCEQNRAPEFSMPVLQFTQRLADIKAGLHLFQQHRAAGNESRADQVLDALLNDLAVLDSDCLKDLTDSSTPVARSTAEFVSEPQTTYRRNYTNAPIQILIVNEPSNPSGLSMPFGAFHGCQVCNVNNHQTALKSLASNEVFDYVVCNGSPMAFDELDLVRTIRSNHGLDDTKIFMTTSSFNTMEHLELSRTYHIDGWLTRPLFAIDLWKHIMESEKFES